MSHDGQDLRHALDALRALGEGGGDPGTRERVLDSLDQMGQRRRTLAACAVVLAVSLLGSSAWGWYSGWLPAVVRAVVGEAPQKVQPPRPPAEAEAPARAPSRARAPSAPVPVTEPVTDAVPVTEPVPVTVPEPVPVTEPVAESVKAPEPRPVPRPAPPRRVAPVVAPSEAAVAVVPAAPAPVPAPAPEPVTPPVPDTELRVYRVAHDLHFRGTNAARALAAWDAYLAEFPSGVLAPEARWNRALALIKLGRTADALAALEPFARSGEGAYRQREAIRLMEALRKGR